MNSELKPDWNYKKLDELGFVGRGRSRHRPRNHPSLYGGPYPFFQTGDVKAAELYLSDYSQTYNEKGLAQSKLWDPGTLCITIAANIAESAILKIKGCFPDSVVGFIADPNEADVRFVKYAIDTMKLRMQSISRGTTQDNLSLDKLLTFDFAAPPLPTQRKIAAILSAYDDLIDNNTRRITLLEQMAQALYREWFVHFRFPGHQDVPLVDSALGPIPESWKVVKMAEIAELLREGIKPYDFGDETFAHYSFPAFDADCMPLLEKGDTIRSNKYLVTDECILLSKLNPHIPRVWLPFPDGNHRAIASTEFLVMEPRKQATRSYLFSICSSAEFLGAFAAFTLGTSTSHQRVKPQDFLHVEIAMPTKALVREFSDLVDPMLEAIHSFRLRNINLRRARDLLLPRLISGQLDVAHLPIDAGSLDAIEGLGYNKT